MQHTVKMIVSVMVLALVGCADAAARETPQALSVCAPETSTYVILADEVAYADAAAACAVIGGELAEFDSTAELQAVYDAWVDAQYVTLSVPSSEAVWVGTWITSVDGDEWGYAMRRGGALFPVEQDDPRLALPACELHAANDL